MAEKEAVTAAIRDSRNLNEAAQRLGISRKTLFNRQKRYGLPPGQDGRPRFVLPIRQQSAPSEFSTSSVVAMTVAVSLIGFGVGYAIYRWGQKRKDAPTVVSGLDVLGVV